jgi:hypothetical protein
MIEQEKFSRLRFKIHKASKDKKIEEQFPGLFKWKEMDWYKRPAKYKDLCYLVFIYDPNSDLIEEFPEIQDRKDAAAVEAGFERKEDGDWPANVKKLMHLEDEKFIIAVLRYLKICKNHIWREICANEIELDRMYQLRLQPIKADPGKDESAVHKSRDELEKMCSRRVDSIGNYYKQFFEDNKDLADKAIEEEYLITPETVFKVIKPLRDAS